MTATVTAPADQHWPWWPLLPLYPYGRRPTLVRELVPGRIWSFEQLHGVWYVAVPIRMTVVQVEEGLMLYSPIPPTGEVLQALHQLERQHGPVRSIVLATSSGLEHKLPVPAMARAFPSATVWVSDCQWSFPLRLPGAWLGFPAERTRVLGRDGYPGGDQLRWFPLGPLDLGLGTFLELACLDLATGCLLVIDALVSIPAVPPAVFDLDPTPLLFHARERGSELLIDTSANRLRGWKRIVLFANFFRPASVSIPALPEIFSEAVAARHRSNRNHFGFYPFRWSADWEQQAGELLAAGNGMNGIGIAPVLERLVFPRSKRAYLEWLRHLGSQDGLSTLISAHYAAPVEVCALTFKQLIAGIEHRCWALSEGSWQVLASIDNSLIRLGIVPHPSSEDHPPSS
jgi:hypothetical protein